MIDRSCSWDHRRIYIGLVCGYIDPYVRFSHLLDCRITTLGKCMRHNIARRAGTGWNRAISSNISGSLVKDRSLLACHTFQEGNTISCEIHVMFHVFSWEFN